MIQKQRTLLIEQTNKLSEMLEVLNKNIQPLKLMMKEIPCHTKIILD